MSLNGDSYSTSSGCVSDMDTLSEDPSPDSPDSSGIESMLSSTDSAIKSLPNDMNDELMNEELITCETKHLVKQLAEEVADDVDEGLVEEELIESEIIIDCLPIESTPISASNPITSECFALELGPRDREDRNELTDGFQSFHTSFDCSSSISSYSKAETASIKSDTSGHESDTRPEKTHNKIGVNSRPIINGIFNSVSKLAKKSDDISSTCIKTNSNNSISNSYYCKWTHCDWPGSKDDLVDHIREIHVELQPYQQQKHNWNEMIAKNKTNNKNNNKLIERKLTDSNTNSNSNCIPNSKKIESTQQYVCLWEGCKVYGKGSLSRNWLERHVLEQHSGPRPFKCIVEGCGARFKVQSALERHVNSHFKPSVDYSNSNCSSDVTNSCNCTANAGALTPPNCCAISDSNSCLTSLPALSPFELHLQQTSRATMSAVRCKTSSSGSVDSSNHFCSALNCSNGTPNKILKRKKSATKLRRKCFYVKCSEDFFDECVMEQVRYGLIQMNTQSGLDISGTETTVTFHSKVIARRESDSGEVNVLLKWEPNDILPDVWIPEEKVPELLSKTVPVSTLAPECLAQLIESSKGVERKPKIKQRRK